MVHLRCKINKMTNIKKHILWADDEINSLKPHIIFLESKGYSVTGVNSGEDAIEFCKKSSIDLLLVDEMMTGLDGLSTIKIVKENHPDIPIIMVTKNEEEWLMEEAIGEHIEDYLTKPVNPSQILIACKKVFEKSHAVFIILKSLDGVYPILGKIGLLLPRYISDFFYDIIAKNRYKIMGKQETCRIPNKEEEEYFLG